MAYAIARHRKGECIVLSLVLVSWLIIGRWEKKSIHYMLIAWPALLVLGAAFLEDVAAKFKLQHVWLTTAALIISVPSAIVLTSFAREQLRADNRVMAERWIQTNLPAGARIGMDWGALPALYDLEWVRDASERRKKQFAGNPDIKIWEHFVARTRAFHLMPMQFSKESLDRTDLDFIILSSYCFQRFIDQDASQQSPQMRDEFAAYREFYLALLTPSKDNRFECIARFEDGSGPVILILVNKSRSEEAIAQHD